MELQTKNLLSNKNKNSQAELAKKDGGVVNNFYTLEGLRSLEINNKDAVGSTIRSIVKSFDGNEISILLKQVEDEL